MALDAIDADVACPGSGAGTRGPASSLSRYRLVAPFLSTTHPPTGSTEMYPSGPVYWEFLENKKCIFYFLGTGSNGETALLNC
jgi:hypothetical protein